MEDPGNLVRADTTVLTSIVSLDPMYVYFDIDERTILRLRRLLAEGKIKSRQEAVLPFLVGLSDEIEPNHIGTINFTDNKIVTSTGTLQVRGVIPNPKPRMLSPGLFVRIRLPIGNTHKSMMIDEQAISAEQSSKFVYVIRKQAIPVIDPKTKKPKLDPATGKPITTEEDCAFAKSIKVGSLVKGKRVVIEGLADGDRVILSGLQRVKSGVQVKAIPANQESEAVEKVAAQSLSTPAPPKIPATPSPNATPPPAPEPSK
jgi:multidrug efflux pump subunit AcrA (membrane-fusion protein)